MVQKLAGCDRTPALARGQARRVRAFGRTHGAVEDLHRQNQQGLRTGQIWGECKKNLKNTFGAKIKISTIKHSACAKNIICIAQDYSQRGSFVRASIDRNWFGVGTVHKEDCDHRRNERVNIGPKNEMYSWYLHGCCRISAPLWTYFSLKLSCRYRNHRKGGFWFDGDFFTFFNINNIVWCD